MRRANVSIGSVRYNEIVQTNERMSKFSIKTHFLSFFFHKILFSVVFSAYCFCCFAVSFCQLFEAGWRIVDDVVVVVVGTTVVCQCLCLFVAVRVCVVFIMIILIIAVDRR